MILLENLKKHESQFRKILDYFNIAHENKSVYKLYVQHNMVVPKYSDILKIHTMNYKEDEDLYEVEISRSFAPLAGHGSRLYFKIEDNKCDLVKTEYLWVS